MRIRFLRWDPNNDGHAEELLERTINEAIKGDPAHFFSFWREWLKRYRHCCVLVTLTDMHFDGNFASQLRVWFGEPSRIERRHADSGGQNCVLDLSATSHEMEQLTGIAWEVAEDLCFGKVDAVDGVTCWRKPRRE